MDEANSWWAKILHNKVDGGGLTDSNKTPGQHSWIGDGTKFMSGKNYINSIRFRIGAIPTKARTSRGQNKDRQCRAGCQASETLNHVVQRCFRMHLTRVKRHNAINSYITRKLLDKEFVVKEEPHIRTKEGLRKPDIIATKGEKVWIIDAQVINDQYNLDRAHRSKRRYYSQNTDIANYVRGITPGAVIVFTPATLNWTGVWSYEAAQDLKNLRLVQKDLKTISARV